MSTTMAGDLTVGEVYPIAEAISASGDSLGNATHSDTVEQPTSSLGSWTVAQDSGGVAGVSGSAPSVRKVWVQSIGWRVLPTNVQYGSGRYWAWDSQYKWL